MTPRDPKPPGVPSAERIVNEAGVDMTDWPLAHYGSERACPHGVGHPAPDRRHHADGIHGCDGCCSARTLDAGGSDGK